MLKAGKWTYSEEELERMFAEATKRCEEDLKTEIQARAARANGRIASKRTVPSRKAAATTSTIKRGRKAA
jgi:hypothetical protein